MINFRVTHYIDLCLHPKVLTREGRPGQLYQARFSVFLILLVSLISALVYAFAANHSEQLFSSLFLGSSLVALLGFRFHARYELTAFLWMLGMMSFEILRVLSNASLSLPFFAWLPIGIGITCYLSGPRLGALYTVIVLGETLLSIRTIADAAARGDLIQNTHSLRGLQINLLLAEIAGGIAIYCFVLLKEKAEHDLEEKRLMRAKAERKAVVREIVGTLAHELNNPIAIIDACLIRYRMDIERGGLEEADHERYRKAMTEAYNRIEKSATDLRGYAHE